VTLIAIDVEASICGIFFIREGVAPALPRTFSAPSRPRSNIPRKSMPFISWDSSPGLG
jgi:hypothetical protein